jgi:hypothetical protein
VQFRNIADANPSWMPFTHMLQRLGVNPDDVLSEQRQATSASDATNGSAVADHIAAHGPASQHAGDEHLEYHTVLSGRCQDAAIKYKCFYIVDGPAGKPASQVSKSFSMSSCCIDRRLACQVTHFTCDMHIASGLFQLCSFNRSAGTGTVLAGRNRAAMHATSHSSVNMSCDMRLIGAE